MNLFLKDLNVRDFLRNYRCVILCPGDRAYYTYSTPLTMLIEEPERHSVPSYRIGDSLRFLTENHLPEYLHDFYPTIDIDFDNPRPRMQLSHNYQTSQFVMPGDAIKSYVAIADDVAKLMEEFKWKVPHTFTKISKETVSRFLKTLDEKEGFDISKIVLAPVKYTLANPGAGWNERLIPEKYIVFDNKLNPIDVNALLEVLDKIIVDD